MLAAKIRSSRKRFLRSSKSMSPPSSINRSVNNNTNLVTTYRVKKTMQMMRHTIIRGNI